MNVKAQILSFSGVNILNSAVPFLLLPILTAYLSPSDYGLLSLVQLLMVISLPILLLNTHGLLTIEYSNLSFEQFQRLFSTIVWIPILGFVFLEAVFFVLKGYITQYLHIPTNYVHLIPFFVLAQAIPTIVPILFQAKKESWNFGKYKISFTIVNILLSLLLVITFSYDWEGRLFGIVGSAILFSFIGLMIFFKLNILKFTLDRYFLKEALRFGVPLIPHSIAGVFLAMSDRIFLVNMLDANAVGVYTVSFQIASAVTIIMGSVNQAWAPHLFEQLNNNPTLEDKKEIVKQTYKIMIGMVSVTVGFILVSPFVFDIFIDEAYQEGKDLVVFIAVAFLFQGFYFMTTNYILYLKKTYMLSYITLFSVVVVWIANYFFIQSFGIIGSAYAMLMSWMIFFLITWIISSKVYKMPWMFL